jgi:RHS repeat-associated protein
VHSNRLDSMRRANSGGSEVRYYEYNPDGSRRYDFLIDSTVPLGRDTHGEQYDALGRMIGQAAQGFTAPNSCGYDPDGRMFHACGYNAVALLGNDVIRDQFSGWTYVHAPGIDEPILAVRRAGDSLVESARLQFVSDGQGQLLAVGDSVGGYALGSPDGDWGTNGLTARAQTFDAQRWTSTGHGAVLSSFRTRQYDPQTGSWLQEDHAGLAGGVNLYQFNGNDPNSNRDPFGTCDSPPCPFAEYWAQRSVQGKGSSLVNDVMGTIATCVEDQQCVGILATALSEGMASGRPVGLTVSDVGVEEPLIGKNPRIASSRMNTDLPGGRPVAKSIFRAMTRDVVVTDQQSSNGMVRRTGSNGVQIRFNPDGTTRLDAPRGPLGRETVHFQPQ